MNRWHGLEMSTTWNSEKDVGDTHEWEQKARIRRGKFGDNKITKQNRTNEPRSEPKELTNK